MAACAWARRSKWDAHDRHDRNSTTGKRQETTGNAARQERQEGEQQPTQVLPPSGLDAQGSLNWALWEGGGITLQKCDQWISTGGRYKTKRNSSLCHGLVRVPCGQGIMVTVEQGPLSNLRCAPNPCPPRRGAVRGVRPPGVHLWAARPCHDRGHGGCARLHGCRLKQQNFCCRRFGAGGEGACHDWVQIEAARGLEQEWGQGMGFAGGSDSGSKMGRRAVAVCPRKPVASLHASCSVIPPPTRHRVGSEFDIAGGQWQCALASLSQACMLCRAIASRCCPLLHLLLPKCLTLG